jgi:hypothetical protein
MLFSFFAKVRYLIWILGEYLGGEDFMAQKQNAILSSINSSPTTNE